MVAGPQSAGSGALTAGVDVGTTSVKVVVADGTGRVVARARRPSGLVVGPGRFEHDAVATWWEAPRQALAAVLGPLQGGPVGEGRLSAVAVSAMMPSVAAVDASGRPLGPGLLYGDPRGAAAGGEAAPEGPTASQEMARLTGWVAEQRPEAAGYWPAQAVANASLGVPGVVDLASAFASGSLFDGSSWAGAACGAAGVATGQMPRVAVFGEAVGHLAPELWPGPGEAPVLAAGSVDGFCEQLVSGAVEDGDLLVVLGSTLVVWLCTPGWPSAAPGLWRVPHLVGGKALVGGASNAGGLWVDWADRLLRPAGPAGEAGEQGGGVEGSNWPSTTGPDGLRPAGVPVWWPWAKGERVPWHDPSLRASMSGADLSLGPGALRRAALEATGFVVRHIAELASASGTGVRRCLVSGGGTANRAWLQALADVLGAPVLPAASPEGAALGAAYLARLSVGLEGSLDDASRWARWLAPVEPRADWADAAEERYLSWLAGLPAVPGRVVTP
jgi:xylulokinase